MEKIAKDLLNTAPVVSKLLKTTIDYPQYLQFLEHIVTFIKPEKQLEVIKNLINTITINLMNLAHFSGILSNAKEYEAVIIILESTLLNPQLPTLVSDGEEKEALYRCRTNLWSAYVNTRNLASAEEQLLLMLKDKPNNSNFYNLFTIYRLNGKFTEAENLIQNASNDIKTLAKMILNSNEISQSNLNSINQNNLPDNCKGMLRIFQYMAKYNKYSTSEKILNKENLRDELIKISKSVNEPYTLAQIALKTKQYELAQQFLEKVPQITLYLDTQVNNTFKELEFLLNPEKHSNQIHIENLTNKLHFSSDQAIKIVDKVSIGLIADKKYNLALEKIDEVLNHEPQNQEVLERGLEVASLINNQEKIQQYSNLLPKDDNYELPKEWDPIEIHKYYQLRKEQDLFHTIQQINRHQEIIPNSIWHIAKEHDITTNDVIPLGKYRGLDCYGKISEKLQKKLDKNQYDKFIDALTKGIIHSPQGKNGIKFIGKKAVEIKIDGDQRLFTNILHSNEQSELLINFDHQGNHNDVVKFAGEHHLEFHQDLL